jgi:hypothetical protein
VKAPVTIDLDDIPWQPHPTIPGIDVRAFQNEADFSPTDILIARVTAGGEIPWHVHDSETEIAYVLQGTAGSTARKAKREIRQPNRRCSPVRLSSSRPVCGIVSITPALTT